MGTVASRKEERKERGEGSCWGRLEEGWKDGRLEETLGTTAFCSL